MYSILVVKVNAIDTKIPSTNRLVLKMLYDSDRRGPEKKIEDIDKKICNTNGLVRKTDYNKNYRTQKQQT